MAWGYAKLFALTGDPAHQKRIDLCLEWLRKNRSAGYSEYCWGNSFSFSTRAGTIPKDTPTIVWSSLIGLAFLEAYEATGIEEYASVAQSVGRWVKELPRQETSRGCCLSYVPFMQSSIHNSNMLGGALLSRVGSQTGAKDFVDLAAEAMRYSCERQRPNGAWFYGEEPKYHWVDSFHTGYNLDCLKYYINSTGDVRYAQQLKLGFKYFRENFFEDSGRPKYFDKQTMPTDIQCAAQAIDTLATFSETEEGARDLAVKVATWTIDEMQDPDGHFYYRDLGWKKIKTPMFHWGQGTMFKALTNLLGKVEQQSPASMSGSCGR